VLLGEVGFAHRNRERQRAPAAAGCGCRCRPALPSAARR
jgi:hypothetical protein